MQSGDLAHARRVASELRAGQVNLNGAAGDMAARSAATSNQAMDGSGASTASRSSSEIKAVLGYQPA